MSPGNIRFIAIFASPIMASLFDWLLSILFNSESGHPFVMGILTAGFAIGSLDWLTKRLGDSSSSVKTNTEKKQ